MRRKGIHKGSLSMVLIAKVSAYANYGDEQNYDYFFHIYSHSQSKLVIIKL